MEAQILPKLESQLAETLNIAPKLPEEAKIGIQGQPKLESVSPVKVEHDDERSGMAREQDNNPKRQSIPPKRSLRERKPRAAQNRDSLGACHICGTNGLRVTLIPCTKGEADCDNMF